MVCLTMFSSKQAHRFQCGTGPVLPLHLLSPPHPPTSSKLAGYFPQFCVFHTCISIIWETFGSKSPQLRTHVNRWSWQQSVELFSFWGGVVRGDWPATERWIKMKHQSCAIWWEKKSALVFKLCDSRQQIYPDLLGIDHPHNSQHS